MKAICAISFFLFTIAVNATTQKPVHPSLGNKQLQNSFTGLDTTSPVNIKSKMLGIWRRAEGENATFEIKPTSIYYFEHFKGYRYNLTGNVLTIKFPDYNFTGKVSFVNETMVIDSKEFGVSKYKKMK